MALEQRIESLRKRHADIDIKLTAEEARVAPDEMLLHRLKSQKLSVKDELSRLLNEDRKAA